jgi:hypothetical protein
VAVRPSDLPDRRRDRRADRAFEAGHGTDPDGRATRPAAIERVGHDAPLSAWVGRLAVDVAARERARAHWLHRQASEEGTFAGVLADLAERGRPIVVHLHNGRVHRGRATVVGKDFVALAKGASGEVLVAHTAIATVRTVSGEPPTSGDRWLRTPTTLLETLSALGDERARVLVLGLDPAHGVSGELRGVGRDVLTIRLDGDGALTYVALPAVAEVSVFDVSG